MQAFTVALGEQRGRPGKVGSLLSAELLELQLSGELMWGSGGELMSE